jgi:dolichyl-diphosphooligosaccharide--protein glycosyltransferase
MEKNENNKNIKYFTLGILILFMFFVYFLSTNQRLNQFDTWKKYPQKYITENYPAMTTLDSFYWLRYAKEYNQGIYNTKDNDTLRFYPDEAPRRKPVPMLSFLLSKVSSSFNGNYYLSGIFLIPFLAGLFIFPLIIYFYRLKMPAAGVLGALIGTFAFVYYARSCTGRVDTDALNLFFPILSSLFILLTIETKQINFKYLFSALSGLSMALFYWWYYHSGFTLIYFLFLAISLIIDDRRNKKLILKCLLLFIIFSNPIWFYNGIHNLIGAFGNYFNLTETKGTGFPNILNTITEAKKISVNSVFDSMLAFKPLTILGLISFTVLSIYKIKKIIPILPLFFIGLLAFKSSNRFAMFLAPFIGIGVGFLIHFILDYINKSLKLNYYIKTSIPYLIVIIIFFSITRFTAYSFVPNPSIESGIFKSFIEMKKTLPENSAVYSWWDYGYAIEDVTGFPAFHDGGSQSSPKTYFIARSLITNSQKELFNTVNYFDNKGIKEIKTMLEDNSSIDTIINRVLNYHGKSSKKYTPVIYFSRDMVGKFGAFSYIGSWDFDINKSNSKTYMQLLCNSLKNNILYCGKNIIDLRAGTINNKLPLKKFITVKDGYVINEKNYNYSKGYYLQILVDGNSLIGTMLMEKEVFYSNFNQMFILGRYNNEYFKEVYNKYPFARAFSIIK